MLTLKTIQSIFICMLVVGIALLGVLGAFPWGVLHGQMERALSAQLGRPATIESVRRNEAWSLTPTIVLSGVRAPQAEWAGDGDLVIIETARIRAPVLPALIGRLRPRSIEIEGMALSLARDENGRKSWTQNDQDDDASEPEPPGVKRLIIRDSIVAYDDRMQDRSFTARVSSDADNGVRLSGDGLIHGEPVEIRAQGVPVDERAAGQPWPFSAEIIGEAVGLTFEGRMRTPLDVNRFVAEASAHGDDLLIVDAVIEAGLPESQPVRLQAMVERDWPDWKVSDLTGEIGRSRIAGEATILKREGRTIIDGVLHATQFDFDDLANREGRQRAAEKRQRYGPRLFPDTAIDLDTVDTTDGRLEISADELLWEGHSPFLAMKGVLVLDHRYLTVEALEVALPSGSMTGDVIVDHRGEAPVLHLNLTVGDGRFADFFPGERIDGALAGHIRLSGPGGTVREAIGHSDGSVAIVALDGVMPAAIASLLGQDVGRGITTSDDELARLNCVIARWTVQKGQAQADPVLIDTTRAQTRAEGSIDFSDERLSLVLNGAPKKDSLLRFDGAIPIKGSIKEPDIGKPDDANVGGVLKSIGEAIVGEQEDLAADADCDTLAETALR